MPMDKETLAALALRYTSTMTSIRGRRVHRLLMREFARFDLVVPVNTADGLPAMLALSESGDAAFCCTDGRGKSAGVSAWYGPKGKSVTTFYDLLKDSLPAIGHMARVQDIELTAGKAAISGTEFSSADRRRKLYSGLRKRGTRSGK